MYLKLQISVVLKVCSCYISYISPFKVTPEVWVIQDMASLPPGCIPHR